MEAISAAFTGLIAPMLTYSDGHSNDVIAFVDINDLVRIDPCSGMVPSYSSLDLLESQLLSRGDSGGGGLMFRG